MKKYLIILGILGFSVLPVLADVPKTMNKLMESWLGENINDVIKLWGTPASQRDVTGGKIYIWTSGNKPNSIRNYNRNTGRYSSVMVSCNKTFTTNDNGKIVDWEWSGNNCPKKIKDVKKLINPKVNN